MTGHVATTPLIATERLILRMPQPEEAETPLRYYTKNREHLANSMPLYPPGFFEVSYWQTRLSENIAQYRQDLSASFFVYLRSGSQDFGDDIIGSANLSQIVRRAAQFCYLGYGLDRDMQGKGYMTEALESLIKFAFDELNLHRIMANYVPANERSGSVLSRLGFVREGYATSYLYLNGRWQDHILTSLTNPSWKPPVLDFK
jgi:ribosomal-protein-alanine N-acetyltransferase